MYKSYIISTTKSINLTPDQTGLHATYTSKCVLSVEFNYRLSRKSKYHDICIYDIDTFTELCSSLTYTYNFYHEQLNMYVLMLKAILLIAIFPLFISRKDSFQYFIQ